MTFSALFSNQFFTWSGHCKKLKLTGKLSDCLQILTAGRLTHEQKNVSANIFFRNIFTMRAIFVWTLHIFLILFRKCSVTSHWNWIWKIADTFLALWPQKQRNTLNKWKTKFVLTCNVQKVIQALAFTSHEKFDNSFFFQNFWYNLIASPISFYKLIEV